MSHHYSGPSLTFPGGDARLNFSDLFVFGKPGDRTKSIVIVNVHPSVGFSPPGPTTAIPFSTTALYEIMIDTDGDAVADLAYSVRFLAGAGEAQTATLRRIQGLHDRRSCTDGEIILKGAPVSTGSDAQVTDAGSYRFFAGWRSDPFFFDTLGALDNLQFTGADFFADKDVCSIVLELPNAALGSGMLGIWARVLDGSSGRWVQVDRGALPSQAPFLAGDALSAYLVAEPAGDAQFIAPFAHALEHTGGYTPREAARTAQTLLPDILPYHPGVPAAFPGNGRALTDDVEIHFLTLITNGKVTGDGLTAHHDLLAEFPYVAPPHGSARA